ncbi:MAG: electron transfer flavoprotein subunit beta/FixA family protein [Spirochaetaceae bacterium]|nr:electron transfer flavoprotein subunit beta/FixA family protein [Spirochaetaceae bacterium]
MKIIVPIKQVPESSNVKMDAETGTIVRSGSEAVVNPLDLYAIEAALQIKDKTGGTVFALSMGPPRAEKAIREAIAMGCDGGYLVSDRKFGGSDTWATSYIISQAIKAAGDFNLIITGERATDGDTAQVGPGIAAWLDIPLATYVSAIFPPASDVLNVERLVEDGYQQLSITLPALLTVVKEIAEPRLPTLEGKKKAMSTEIPLLNSENMELESSFLGLQGSPTKVVKIQTPQVTRGGKIINAEGDTPGAVSQLMDFLKEKELV